jgi:hypothetical protein
MDFGDGEFEAARPALELKEIAQETYARYREAFLDGRPHVELSREMMELIASETVGGRSLYSVNNGDAICAVLEADPMRVVLAELITNPLLLEISSDIDAEIASLIVNLVDSHPSYVQQLAHLSWMNTSVVCSKDVVMEAHQTIVNQMHNLFSIITASLTTQQLCYIHAVLEGETIISTSEVLHRHHITSATSASRSKVALLQKGILYNVGGKMTFSDPLYAYWLRNRYFNKCK